MNARAKRHAEQNFKGAAWQYYRSLEFAPTSFEMSPFPLGCVEATDPGGRPHDRHRGRLI
jgi:hypothetical protein